MLLGQVLGVEEHVGEKAVAVDAAHQAYVFEHELQVLAGTTVPEDKPPSFACICFSMMALTAARTSSCEIWSMLRPPSVPAAPAAVASTHHIGPLRQSICIRITLSPAFSLP